MNLTPTLLLCLLLATSSGGLSAQARPHVGDLVRGRQDGRLVQGRLLEAPSLGSPLRLARNGPTNPFELPWDTAALAYRVRGSHKVKSALIGLGAGATTGALLGLLIGDDECTGWGCLVATSGTQKAVVLGGVLGASGGMVGAIRGSRSVWAPIDRPVEPRRVGLHLSAQGAGLRVAF
jgi:hypothetical protein